MTNGRLHFNAQSSLKASVMFFPLIRKPRFRVTNSAIIQQKSDLIQVCFAPNPKHTKTNSAILRVLVFLNSLEFFLSQHFLQLAYYFNQDFFRQLVLT